MSEYIVRETGYPGTLKTEIVGELVRCKDCQEWEHLLIDEDGDSYCPVVDHYISGDWYCADGERKDDE